MNKTLKKCVEWAKGLSGYNEKGEEIPDPTPLEPPVDFERPLPLAEEIRRLVANQTILQDLDKHGLETFEEADDFNIPDEEDIASPWEENFDTGKIWTREQEIRAGLVENPNYQEAKAIVRAYEDAARLKKRSSDNNKTTSGSSAPEVKA